jgi:hypothetical protein
MAWTEEIGAGSLGDSTAVVCYVREVVLFME